MRINRYIARATGLSRRAADKVIADGRVTINGVEAKYGQKANETDDIRIDEKKLLKPPSDETIILNKPVGYVVSRNGQGSKTIYGLLPSELHNLKPVGRLDKDSSGLLLLTSDGQLAQELTHPKYQKTKVYEVTLNKPLTPHDKARIEQGVKLEDGLSRFDIEFEHDVYEVRLAEGRNRQIRRTFKALGYEVKTLHRTIFGEYNLRAIKPGDYSSV